MLIIASVEQLNRLLDAISEHLASAGRHYELVAVGGSALLALGLITRPTKDLDVVAVADHGRLETAEPLPRELIDARDRVARDFDLADDWINAGPTGLLDLGLPDGFLGRVETRSFGDGLTVHFASRLDQIHFKLYALVDQGGGRHDQDLRSLKPTMEELLRGACWTRTHDPSAGFQETLVRALSYLGVEDADLEA